MPSEIKSQARRERFLLTYNVCFGTFGGVLREHSVRCGPGLCVVKGSLPAWHLKVSTGGEAHNLQPYLGRGPSPSSEVDILLCRETRLSALHCSHEEKLKRNFSPQTKRNFEKSNTPRKSRKKSAQDLSALLFLLCTV